MKVGNSTLFNLLKLDFHDLHHDITTACEKSIVERWVKLPTHLMLIFALFVFYFGVASPLRAPPIARATTQLSGKTSQESTFIVKKQRCTTCGVCAVSRLTNVKRTDA